MSQRATSPIYRETTVRTTKIARMQKGIIRWFQRHQRDLPWRHTRDPYRILVSEVMLQQTQVDRVVPKYQAFLRRFPTVRVLARATPRDVLLVWEGMGYNRRALYLLRMARAVVAEFGGTVPTRVEDLTTFPGVGAYTAAAVATFSTGVPHALADTNVMRVLNRVFLGGRVQESPRRLLALAERTMPRKQIHGMHPALWGHALMDFGALVCRAKPRCEICPLTRLCRAYPQIVRRRASGVRKRTTASLVPDRIYRGRILQVVREWDPTPVPFSHVRVLMRERPARDLRRLIHALVAEGLLTPVGSRAVRLPTP